MVKRRTIQKATRWQAGELKEELRRRWHERMAEIGEWLRSVVQGYFNYHAVPGNMDSLNSFREVIWHWYRRYGGAANVIAYLGAVPVDGRSWIPRARILHPHPNVRFDVRHPR